MTWVIKWRDTLPKRYFVGDLPSGEADWSRHQKKAKKFASLEEARTAANWWHGEWRPRVIRLVPKVPS